MSDPFETVNDMDRLRADLKRAALALNDQGVALEVLGEVFGVATDEECRLCCPDDELNVCETPLVSRGDGAAWVLCWRWAQCESTDDESPRSP